MWAEGGGALRCAERGARQLGFRLATGPKAAGRFAAPNGGGGAEQVRLGGEKLGGAVCGVLFLFEFGAYVDVVVGLEELGDGGDGGVVGVG